MRLSDRRAIGRGGRRWGGVVLGLLLGFVPAHGEGRVNGAGQGDAFQRGLEALKENRVEAALGELTTAEVEAPGSAAVRNFRGIVLARMGRNGEAEGEYREAIRLEPGMEAAYRNLGFQEWMDGRPDAAREDLRKALTLAGDDAYAHYYLGRVELDGQRYGEAFREIERSGVPLPDDPEVLLAATKGYRALGRGAEAKATVGRIEGLRMTEEQRSRLAHGLLGMGEAGGAIELLERAGSSGEGGRPQWASFDLALAELEAGDPQKAAEAARRYLERSGKEAPGKEGAQAWTAIAVADARMGKAEAATEAFRRAAALDPAAEEGWLNLTRELMERGRFEEARAATEEGLRANPTSYVMELRMGAVELAMNHFEEAERSFRRLVEAGDPLPTSYVGLAQVLLRTGRAAEAVAELRSARGRIGPSFLLSYFEGLSLTQAGRPAEAVAAFGEAVREQPGSEEAHLNLGKSELAAGRFPEAVAELEAALRLNPKDQQAGRLLQRARRRAGDVRGGAVEEGIGPGGAVGLGGDFSLPEWKEPPGVR